MNSEPLPSIISGREYVVVKVGARADFVLYDLLGEVEVVLDDAGRCHSIAGVGAAASYGVRFYQKDPDRHGHDVRTWRIRRTAENVVTAVHDAAI